MLRSSGTEPKLKHYFYVIGRITAGADLEETRARTNELLDRIVDDLMRASGEKD
jgi:phosphomannomutase